MRRRLTNSERVTSKRDIHILVKSETRYYSRYLGITVATNSMPVTRLFVGIRNARAIRAVKRNKLKRIGRELFRNNKPLLPHCCDIGLIVLPYSLKIPYSKLEFEYQRMLLKLQEVKYGKKNDHCSNHIDSHNS